MRTRRLTAFVLTLLTMMTTASGTVTAISDNELSAPSAVLMDAQTGEVLYEKASHEVRECASITKVMTLTLVMEALDSGKIRWTDTVTASEHAASMGGSDIWLEPGETMTVEEMVKATMVASANDAAVALAEHICGSEDEFVKKMNEKAKSLGMKETVFKNCNGLDEEGHVTSAYDVALMSKELIRHKSIYKFSGIWMDELRGGATQLVNTNKLLKSYRGITGLKTGTTSKAGSCITATAERDGLSLIAVVLGAPSGKQRFKDAALLLDYGFANYAMYTPVMPDQAKGELPVTGGMSEKVQTEVSEGRSILLEKGGESDIKAAIQLPESVAAPIEKGQQLGRVVLSKNGAQIDEYPITAAESVDEIKLGDVFGIIFGSLFA